LAELYVCRSNSAVLIGEQLWQKESGAPGIGDEALSKITFSCKAKTGREFHF
jgi:hypothetical protein